jgi:hypothetical protein
MGAKINLYVVRLTLVGTNYLIYLIWREIMTREEQLIGKLKHINRVRNNIIAGMATEINRRVLAQLEWDTSRKVIRIR